MKNFLLILLFFAVAIPASSQQDPLYAQYFNNPMLINPAFAGSFERLYAGVAYRSQWSGVDGGPTTLNFNSHLSMVDNKVGAGIFVVQDKLGDIRNTQYGAAGSYRIKLTNAMFSFGLQAGVTRFATDPDAVKVLNNPDPAFNKFSETKFNLGAGLLLQNEKFTLSLSVPRMLPSTVSQGGESIQIYSQNYYLYGSYMFYVGDKIQFKPSALLRATSGTPIAADLNCNFIFNKLYTAGVFTRQFNTYGVLVQMVMRNYRFGYIFEVPGKSSALRYNTHEVSLSISLPVLKMHNAYLTGY
jgi:type IX secretion system PorP/SprF family membrane protein